MTLTRSALLSNEAFLVLRELIAKDWPCTLQSDGRWAVEMNADAYNAILLEYRTNGHDVDLSGTILRLYRDGGLLGCL